MNQAIGNGRERILASARRLFAERGFDGVSIRDIGAEAGLTNPALYRHFADKEALGIELYRQCYVRMLNAIEDRAAVYADPLDKIEAYVFAVIELFEDEPDLVLFVDEHQTRFWPKIRSDFQGRTLSERIGGWIGAARRAGEIATDARIAMQTALVMGLVSHWCAMRTTSIVKRESPLALAAFARQSLIGSSS